MPSLDEENEFFKKIKGLTFTKKKKLAAKLCYLHGIEDPSILFQLMDEENITGFSIGGAAKLAMREINEQVIKEDNSALVEDWKEFVHGLQSPLISKRQSQESFSLPTFDQHASQKSNLDRQSYILECARLIYETVNFYASNTGFRRNRTQGMLTLTRSEQDLENFRLAGFLQCDLIR